MTEEHTQYDITPDDKPAIEEKFCPLASAAIPGPLGKLTFLRPPCDPEHCALGIPQDNACFLSHITLL